MPNEYVPGVCNIGPAEIALRRRFGWIGLGATALLWVALALLGANPYGRLIIALPAMLAAIGFLQAHFHFCAGFGLRGLKNFGPKAGKGDTVMQAEFRKQDRSRALQIIAYSIVLGVAAALAAYFL
jgi:hypothetical protein